jgi:hypothetical protein
MKFQKVIKESDGMIKTFQVLDPNKKVCAKCKGKGCVECDGYTCPTCVGTKMSSEGKKCTTCNGVGKTSEMWMAK